MNNYSNPNANPDLIKPLEYVDNKSKDPSIKFLGVYLDQHLNFRSHIDKTCKKLSSSIYHLKRAKNLMSKQAKISAYYALVSSHLQYAILAWSIGAESYINRLFSKQKQAIRIIENLRHNAHTGPSFKKLKILPLPTMIEFAKLKFFHQFTINKLPSSFNENWPTIGDFNPEIDYNFRDNLRYRVEKFNIEFAKKFPLFSLPAKWNEIKDNTDMSSKLDFTTKNSFKNSLRKFMVNELSFEIDCNRNSCPDCRQLKFRKTATNMP